MEHRDVVKLDSKHELKKIKKKLDWLFYWETIGIVFVYAALVELQSIQTSLNISGNIGAIALTAGYVSAILFSFFLAPLSLRVLGLSKTIVICNFTYLVYNLANYYPVGYLLIPGAIISGMARSVLIPACTMTIFQLAERYEQCGSKALDHYVTLYQGRFFSFFNSVGIIGNVLSSIIIYAGAAISESNKGNDYPGDSTTTYLSPTFTEQSENFTGTHFTTKSHDGNPYSECGVNDCQDPEAVEENIDNYIPPDQGTIYVLISSSIILNVLGIVIHWVIYPGLGRFGHKLEKISEELQRIHDRTSENSDNHSHSISTSTITMEPDKISTNRKSLGKINDAFCEELNESEMVRSDSIKTKGSRASSHLSEDTEGDNTIKKRENENNYFETLRITFLFYLKPRAMLLCLFGLHYGTIVGFFLSDVTRAYASCVTGIQSIGIYMSCLGVTAVFFAYVFSRWGKLIGRNVILTIEFIIELLVLLMCYLWEPDTRTVVVVFAIFVGAGFCIGILRPILVIVYAEHFPEAKRIAVTVWNFWVTLGLSLEYGLTTVMCVRDKIYLQFGVLVASSALYGIAEFLLLRENRQEKKEKEMSDTTSSDDVTRF